MQDYVDYIWDGNKEQVTWTVTPSIDTPSDGYEFEEGDCAYIRGTESEMERSESYVAGRRGKR